MSASAEVRLTGTVKWFNTEKGYGFIAPDSRIPGVDRDLFCHVKELPDAGRPPEPGSRVSFTVGERNGRKNAAAVRAER